MQRHPPSRPAFGHRIGVLSTYPPKLCGLATFALALQRALVSEGHQVDVVRIDDGDDLEQPIDLPVAAVLTNGDAASIRAAAAALSRCDIAFVQHEYGIYGGPDGEEVIDLLRAITAPTIVILHTVLLHPTPHQRSLLVDIAALADMVVVMTDAAHQRLLTGYPVDPHSVITIAHGAATLAPDQASPNDHVTRPQLLTWGLLGPGKGIEHVIRALAQLHDMAELPHYTVAGVTHPKVHARDGDAYRQSLIDLAEELGVLTQVTFDDTYRNLTQLTRFVASAEVVVLPYDSRDQVTSGVLVDAIAVGRPVIATAFPHAVELLSSGAGLIVDHQNGNALATAIRHVLTDPTALHSMAVEAQRLAPALSWGSVAQAYLSLADSIVESRASMAI